MNYKITITNPGSHYANPLLKLADCEYDSRGEACEAIYKALYDVIDSEDGCEMVAKPSRKAYWVKSGEGECGRWHRIITTELGIKQHLTRERCGGDRWAIAVTDIYRTVDDMLAGVDIEAHCPVNVPDDAADDVGVANDVYEAYIDDCHAYIMREGCASEDGVTATVEEC